jgi:hypothetical protein
VKSHSIYVEERTVYICSCKAEFEDIKKAEAHMRNPPAERSKSPPRASRPKRRPSHRIETPRTVEITEMEMPSGGP